MSFAHRMIVLALMAVSLASCSHKYKIDEVEKPSSNIAAKSSFYILQPIDGQYGAINYPGSGQATANAVRQALVARGADALVANSREDRDAALNIADQKNIDYVFETTIVHWEDRSTEWSGRPDRITLHFAVFNARTGEEVASATNRASSRWMTFGGDHPQDLLPNITELFVDTLF